MDFDYINIQKKMIGGHKTTRKVAIKNNKGFKSVCTYKNGKKCFNKKKKLTKNELNKIKKGIFIPGLFNDITHKNRIHK